jgi:hypothetical protein
MDSSARIPLSGREVEICYTKILPLTGPHLAAGRPAVKAIPKYIQLDLLFVAFSMDST